MTDGILVDDLIHEIRQAGGKLAPATSAWSYTPARTQGENHTFLSDPCSFGDETTI